VLSKVDFPVEFDIYGTIEDTVYWTLCLDRIKVLPDNVVVNYLGAIKPNDVVSTLQKYHMLFHPSQGENFGHTILESFVAGRPALISDQTYWLGLEKDLAGWDLELKHHHFKNVLSLVYNMSSEDFQLWCHGAYIRAEKYFYNTELIAIYQNMFNYKL
jgi:glycosyltransferase involved in cell wall biosynthesis